MEGKERGCHSQLTLTCFSHGRGRGTSTLISHPENPRQVWDERGMRLYVKLKGYKDITRERQGTHTLFKAMQKWHMIDMRGWKGKKGTHTLFKPISSITH